jgi:hypothetical protein
MSVRVVLSLALVFTVSMYLSAREHHPGIPASWKGQNRCEFRPRPASLRGTCAFGARGAARRSSHTSAGVVVSLPPIRQRQCARLGDLHGGRWRDLSAPPADHRAAACLPAAPPPAHEDMPAPPPVPYSSRGCAATNARSCPAAAGGAGWPPGTVAMLNRRPTGNPAIPCTSVLGTMVSPGGRCVVTATWQFAYRPSGIAALALAVVGDGL